MNRPFSISHIWIFLRQLLPYLGVTFSVVGLTVLFSLILSIGVVKLQLSKNSFLKGFANFYIHITRCTPSIVLLFIVFYGIPKFCRVLFHVHIDFWPKIIFVTIALTLLYTAQLAEIIRSAYLAVGKNQYEAGLSIGLSPFQTIFRIVLPQAVVYALPNLGNSLIALLKEGSLAFTIGLIDIMGKGNVIIATNYGAYALETYIALSFIYWILTFIIENLFKFLEKHFSRGHINVA